MTSSIEMRRPGYAPRKSSRSNFMGDGEHTTDTLDKRFPSLSEGASLGVLVPQTCDRDRFYSTLYSRWLADFKLIECALALPIQQQQSEWLRDYRDFLLVALGHGDAMARTVWCQASVRRFLCRIRNSHDRDIPDFIRNYPIRGLRAAEQAKVANVLQLFRSMPRARSLTEGLGFRIVMTPMRS